MLLMYKFSILETHGFVPLGEAILLYGDNS